MLKSVVVLDTNIYISSLFWQGNPYKIIQKAIDEEFTVFTSNKIILEIKKVLARDFGISEPEINEFIDSVIMFTKLVETNETINMIKEDDSDNRILECASACKANFIVTQDNHLLKIKKFREVEILNPLEFLKKS